ncbi:1,4-dihydroxy-2-naphthoyl-CoA hydrolase [Planctomycetes bacterium Pan216]|uniref:1,4-dihydroxy-2-naphthoyl-CoA hydrolase n=1 Tax=Kolteria novifilia TaxID=2527975 RepID=A0A518BD60_9BACT|nr:1,4-dihydroxy-2-naphthoyl-CoA hydrolase [Planctomycetes bacterium Pan216]
MTDSTPFVYERRVAFSDTDMAGIAHFTAFMRYAEEAEHAFLRSLDMGIMEKRGEEKLSWPRVNIHCDFHRPIHFDDVVQIEVAVKELKEKAVTYCFKVKLKGKLMASATSTAVYCKVTQGKLASVPIPPEFVERLRSALLIEDK